MAVANCPSCGAPIEFKVGSSIVVVCEFCRTVVARSDRGLEDLGKVAALVDTGSPLRRDLPGRYRGIGFRIVGRTQMRHPMGGVWDEWYAALDDGRWGWLAEAQGKFYFTFKTAAEDLPPLDSIQVGYSYRSLVVTEISTASVISGEGEIPWRVEPGSSYDYADLSGAGNRFGTIDYSEDAPLLFAGEQTTLHDLGIDVGAEPARVTRVRVDKLSCSKCGGALNLVAPDAAERVICPNCGAVHDLEEGNLKYLATLEHQKKEILIPLGQHGSIDGQELIAAGFMERFVTVDGDKYFWTEYLLFNPKTKSFAWLVDSDGHWSFVLPMNAGDVEDAERNGAARTIACGGKTYRIFADAVATVDYVAGEFYWKVEAGETARAIDYIAPPEGISKEISGAKGSQEINYSHGRYMTPAEVETAFSVKGLPGPSGVGMLQPYVGQRIAPIWLSLVAAIVVVALFLAIARSRPVVLTDSVHFDQATDWGSGGSAGGATTDTAPPPPANSPGESSGVVFTKPFQLAGGRMIEIEGRANLNNEWVHVSGDLFNEQSGLVEPFELPLEKYEGVEDGEHWSEGSPARKAFLSAVPPGTYSLRLEGQWDTNHPPPPVMVRVREGVFRWLYFFMAIVLVTIPAILSLLQRGSFETRRWSEAMFTPAGTSRGATGSASDDDE